MTAPLHHFAFSGYGMGAVSPIMSATGGVLMSASNLAGPAKPFVQLAGAVVELLAAIGVGAGCGQTCIAATSFANQAEVLLKNNLATYLALATPRPESARTAALNIFSQIWLGLQYSCAGVPGVAGQNCIGDRQAGACHLKDANGNCWNWFIGYHDPIANDTNTYNDSVGNSLTASGAQGSALAIPAASAIPGMASTVAPATDYSMLWIGAAVLAGLFMVSKL